MLPPVVEKKKVRGKKNQKKKNDPRKLEISDACFELGRACTFVGDVDDARRYLKRTKEGFEEQLGRDSEKALGATYDLTMTSCENNGEVIDKTRDLLKRMERALGEENVVTLDTLNQLGIELKDIEDYQEAKELWERCLTGRTKMLGNDHTNTLMALNNLNNLGCVYDFLKNTEKALEYYERVLKG
ncbi:hypothetical protein TrLO_g2846 [Triparma laevis f. longispina]|nr:hypothetical protein TrLO_g2846 [Triparma laevis f. longispina]